MKIVVASDNHWNIDVLNKILFENPDADYYWHLGDSEFNAKSIEPFIGVLGNNDYDLSFPEIRIFEKMGHRFLLTHGHHHLVFGINGLVSFAKEKECDIVLYGHTHNPSDITIKGVRLINPGSCLHNRSDMKPTYCVININDKGLVKAELKLLSE